MSDPIHILSLGAGVQSSTLALMAAAGEVTPMPAFAVFADTGDEPDEVYEWLTKLREMLPFRVKIAHRDTLFGKLSDNLLEWGHSQIPAFYVNPETGAVGIGKRQCTKHWKIVPVRNKIREATNTKGKHLPAGYVSLWHGISIDEIGRAKPSREKWIEHRWPLLEKRMTRHDCQRWLEKRGLKAPKSACVFCPYRGPAQWAESKTKPEEWAGIVKIDRALNLRGEFLHPQCIPIDEVDFDPDESSGQMEMFQAECEGMCGV